MVGRYLVVLIVLSLCSLTACDNEPGSQEPSGVGEDFAAEATSVCEGALAAKQAWSAFPVPDFNPTQPDPSAFPEVAAWLENEVAPTFEDWLSDLTALGAPPSGQEAWSDVLTAVDGIVRLNADQVVAANGGDAEGFVQATNSLGEIQTELEDATEAAGVAACADVHA